MLAAAGTLDSSFDTDGRATAAFGLGLDQATASVVQSDGKIVVAGWTVNVTDRDFAIARFNADGTLDSSFSGDGRATVSFGGLTVDQATSVAIQPDGKIVVAGTSVLSGITSVAVARLNVDGTLDNSFSGDGILTTAPLGLSVLNQANDVAIQSDGKIVIGGTTGSSVTNDFLLIRYNADGSLDTSFSGDGVATTSFGLLGIDSANAIAIQGDGKIVAAGVGVNVTDNDFALARFNANGSLDTSFGTGGRVMTNFGLAVVPDVANAIVLQPNGRFVVAGSTVLSGGVSAIAVARYTVAGTLDASFGGGDGQVTTQIGGLASFGNDLLLQTDGKLVAGGQVLLSGVQNTFGLARYNADGTLDSSFGTGGALQTSFNTLIDGANDLSLQSDGKIVAAGLTTLNPNVTNFAVARFIGDNHLPIFPTLNQTYTVAPGTPLTINLSATDSDGDAVTLSASNLPAGATFNPATGVFNWTPPVNASGSFGVLFTANDGTGATSEAVTINVSAGAVTNQPPTLQQIGNKVVNAGQPLTFTVAANDPEGDALTFSATSLPAGATFNAATRTFTWTPTAAQGPGVYNVTFQVTDGTTPVSETIQVGVLGGSGATNVAPVFNTTPDQSVNAGSTLTFTVSATDPNGDPITYSAASLPAGATFNPATGTFTWAVGANQGPGVYHPVFTASDGTNSSTETVDITVVGGTNQAPVIAPIGNKTIAAGSTLTFTVSATDADGNPITYSAANLPTGATFDAGTKTFTWTPTTAQGPAVYNVTFLASDGLVTTSQAIQIGVIGGTLPGQASPVLTSIGPKTVAVDANLAFTVTATDPNGDPITYSVSNLPTGATFNTTTGAFSWTPTGSQGPGVYKVTFSASDGNTTTSEEVPITVTGGTNTAPVITPIPNKTIAVGNQLTFTVTATDDASQTLTYTATNHPPGATFDAGTHVFTWTPTSAQGPGVYTVNFQVSDGGLMSTATAQITVTGGTNQSPVFTEVPDQSVEAGQTLTFTVAATDPNGTPLTYSATNLPPGATFDPETRVFTYTPTTGQSATCFMPTFIVSDGGLTDTMDVMITVTRNGQGPFVRFFRVYNPNADLHTFTTSYGEFTALTTLGYRDESTGQSGIGVLANADAGALPVHRLYNKNNGEHYYTLSDGERDELVRVGWTYEKDEGYLYSAATNPCVTLIYRLYNQVDGGHLFTESAAIRDAVLAQFPGIWIDTEPLGYGAALSGNEGFPPGTTSIGGASGSSAPVFAPLMASAETSSGAGLAETNAPVVNGGLIASGSSIGGSAGSTTSSASEATSSGSTLTAGSETDADGTAGASTFDVNLTDSLLASLDWIDEL